MQRHTREPRDPFRRAFDAPHYIVEELAHHIAGVHVVNVRNPVMSGNITSIC